MWVTAIVPAAGRGHRMGSVVPKQFLPLAGKPVLARTLAALDASSEVSEILLVVDEAEMGRCRREILEPYKVAKLTKLLAGGTERQYSVEAALSEVREDARLVLVHDGVRALVTTAIIAAAVKAAATHGAAAAAIPVRDTIKRANAGTIVGTVDREGLWAVQTPQVFRRDWIVEAYRRAREDGFVGTDDAGLVERLGHTVKLVEGSSENIKITTAEDLVMAEAVLRERGT